ncbi:uncharacterized protein RCC_03114 [Ramularia collo-cygni]|uniref:Integral membrane protein n=1 Tax=Ramularia collo-cygni TaxID=112498 RepID=A0A2D3UW23_9PEZI|nr:uncharacterized protein RCC_03114 [Ramularia collo-cygni]CZT17280.1 uncharacterized protein RCC_03114 [Ramularia collo-cygni]
MPNPRAVVSDSTILKTGFLLPGEIVSLLTSMISLPIIAIFFWQRLRQAHVKAYTVASCALLMTYISSFLFVFVLTALLHIRSRDNTLCDAVILLCVTLFVVTKAATILFLIERAYIISFPILPRYQHPEYVLSNLLIFVPYATIAGLSIYYRVAFTNEHGVCIIGIQMVALLPLLLIEVLAYLYLTARFLIPLLMVRFGWQELVLPLRRVFIRTCIATAVAMVSTLAVKISLTMFNGEPAWLCCMTCKIDALIGCTMLHWMTKPEGQSGNEQDTPQMLGIHFDKESSSAVERRQDSGTNSVVLNSTSSEIKPASSGTSTETATSSV